MEIKLTAYSHGAGCGCKISPAKLKDILREAKHDRSFTELLVGNDSNDDAAVIDFNGSDAIISTTDFFMPIVDDPTDFGRIAATNAISDIYAMGGKPVMALSILGWPMDKLSTEIAGQVISGAQEACHSVGIPLAGGHSIDTAEPIFGLAVTGSAPLENIKRNNTAKPGGILFLTKPIGIGLVSTAQKKGFATSEDLEMARESMLKMNSFGMLASGLPHVHAMTDVTGFGLAGHLIELAEASNCKAKLHYSKIPLFSFTKKYLDKGAVPGGTKRNWDSYSSKVSLNGSDEYRIISDPQTSGGLLIAVDPQYSTEFSALLRENQLHSEDIGTLVEAVGSEAVVEIIA